MRIFPYFYFSNNILFDFPKQWFNFFVVDLVLAWESMKWGILCKMRWRGTTGYNVTVVHISTVIGGKARYHIRR
jgi:hypothetical protein